MNYKRLTFSRLIRRNEFRELIGWRYQTLIFLSAILLITFLCFGFAKSAFNHVEELSRDPFSNWINIKFNSNVALSLNQLDKSLSDEEFRDEYLIANSDFYALRGFSFFNVNHELGLVYNSRTIDPDSPVLDDLLKGTNLIHKNFPDSLTISTILKIEPKGIIVTESLIQELGYKRTPANLNLFFQDKEIALPIVAVVKKLPDQVHLVCTNALLCSLLSQSLPEPNPLTLEIVAESLDTNLAFTIQDEIAQALKFEYSDNITINVFKNPGDTNSLWRFDIPNEGMKIPRKEKFILVSAIPALLGHNVREYYQFTADPDCKSQGLYQDYLAIEFRKLDRIRQFADMIDSDYDVSLNMETQIQRENYMFVGNLALAAIIMVILFSVFSLTLYISETFKNHILKVKKNLGNLMALGASNHELIRLYLRVAFRMLLYAILIAFVAGELIGEAFERIVLGKLIVLKEGEDYFSLLNLWLAFFIVLIIVIALFMTFITIKRILKVSPGDLIYERAVGNKEKKSKH
jgi:hypothetical protein